MAKDEIYTDKLDELIRDLSPAEAASEARRVIASGLKTRLDACKTGNEIFEPNTPYSQEYEAICKEILSICLSKDISNPSVNREERIAKIVDRSYRRIDLAVHNNPISKDSIWHMLKTKLTQCNILIFECKNSENPVQDFHIFQLFMYLNPMRGKFGIILSRDGKTSDLANEAIERFYNLGFVILVFSDDDLKLMLDNYVNEDTQEQFMIKKLGYSLPMSLRLAPNPLIEILGFQP